MQKMYMISMLNPISGKEMSRRAAAVKLCLDGVKAP